MKVRLGDVLEEVCDKTKYNNQHLILTASKNGIFAQTDYFKKQVASKSTIGYKIIKKGEFTYRAMSDTGKFYPNMLETEDIGIVSPAYPVFRISRTDLIFPDYLKYYFKSNAFQRNISTFTQGSTRASVKFSKIKTIQIKLPDISTQMKIVNNLKHSQMLIDINNEALSKLDDLVKARFVEMFDKQDECEKDKIINHIENPVAGEWGKESANGEGIKVLRTTNFTDTGIIDYNNIAVRDIPVDRLYKKGLKNGDILIEKSGGSDKKPVGRVVLYLGDNNKYLYNNFTAVLRIKKPEIMNYRFLFYYLYLLYWKGGTRKFESKTTGIHNLNLNQFLNNVEIKVPPIDSQIRFANFVAQVDKSKFVIQKSLEKTQMLFDSLMQEYFG